MVSKNPQDNNKVAWLDNATDSGVDRRVTDVTGHAKLDSIIANGSLLAGITWDYVKATYPTSSSETYTFKTGGAGGTTTATVSIVYTDDTKENLDTVTRT